jgi:hypothetical protein
MLSSAYKSSLPKKHRPLRLKQSPKPKVKQNQAKVKQPQPKVKQNQAKVRQHQPKVKLHQRKANQHRPKVNPRNPKVVKQHRPKVKLQVKPHKRSPKPKHLSRRDNQDILTSMEEEAAAKEGVDASSVPPTKRARVANRNGETRYPRPT